MFLRLDKLQIELPRPQQADPAAAGVVQELMGGKFGEMSTLMNCTYQSFNMRGKSKILYRFSPDDYRQGSPTSRETSSWSTMG